jgi:hypothetical protein
LKPDPDLVGMQLMRPSPSFSRIYTYSSSQSTIQVNF